jgi:hypothetical protein
VVEAFYAVRRLDLTSNLFHEPRPTLLPAAGVVGVGFNPHHCARSPRYRELGLRQWHDGVLLRGDVNLAAWRQRPRGQRVK